jgi:hypothetical protein
VQVRGGHLALDVLATGVIDLVHVEDLQRESETLSFLGDRQVVLRWFQAPS